MMANRCCEPVTDVSSSLPTERTLSVCDVADLVDELATYHAYIAPCFRRYEQRAWAEVYLRGLLTADVPRKNVEAMALRLFGSGPDAPATVRALQQFVGEGGWEDTAILAAHRRLVDATLGEDDGVLIIDGSDFPKQGSHSAGVSRQWCGHSGKKDNCQAGVFLGYASREGYTLLDRRLYLPACWFTSEYAERWDACRIPEDTPFRTKHELAAEFSKLVLLGIIEGGLHRSWSEALGAPDRLLADVLPIRCRVAMLPNDTARAQISNQKLEQIGLC